MSRLHAARLKTSTLGASTPAEAEVNKNPKKTNVDGMIAVVPNDAAKIFRTEVEKSSGRP